MAYIESEEEMERINLNSILIGRSKDELAAPSRIKRNTDPIWKIQ